uniref:Uncharacterized protein AlNc14C32G2946 n=1 Tax=Albugo laibachii Nc14 TaxID=890382 RepID=F0W7Z6_9STRA|nr:conserved hypothetical protein [Albugo laibachii Nc14]|eukprot:CCA17249.1 conserved hypothetical protein [Albugo laibachii Nc14]
MERASRRKRPNATQNATTNASTPYVEADISKKTKSGNDQVRQRDRKESLAMSDVEMSHDDAEQFDVKKEINNTKAFEKAQEEGEAEQEQVRRSTRRSRVGLVEDEPRKVRSASITSSKSTEVEEGEDEPQDEDMKKEQELMKHYEEELKDLERKKKMIEEGTFAEYCRRITDYKEERKRLLQSAQWHRTLQMKNIQDLYDFELKRSHDIAESTKTAIKTQCLIRMDCVLQKLQQELLVIENKKAVFKHPAESELLADLHANLLENDSKNISKKQRLGKSFDLPRAMVNLNASAVADDFTEIIQLRKQTAAAVCPEGIASNDVRLVSRRRLYVNSYVFEEGDDIILECEVQQEEWFGNIESITGDAIHIRLTPSNQKVRVYLACVRSARCCIKPNTVENRCSRNS